MDAEERSTEISMEELAALVDTAGADTVAMVLQTRQSPDPRSFLGAGKLQEIKEIVTNNECDLVVIDNELSPSQARAIEEELGVRVVDRSGLILDIFAQRARTKEGRLQVQLAQYEYLLPRLTGMWTHLKRQAGTSAPIGTRGPGETQLETDRRHIRRRIRSLRLQLDSVEQQRERRRERRKKDGIQTVAIVGYTNAGKSTLLNALTQAGVLAEDKLFATLDPTARALRLPDGRQVLLIDTVGFVRRLPHHLVEAFRSTLEEAVEADVILNVCDASSPEAEEHLQVTRELLQELGCGDVPILTVFNKCDLSPEPVRAEGPSVCISAKTGQGLPRLLEEVAAALPPDRKKVTLLLPFRQGALAEQCRREGAVEREEYVAEGLSMTVTLGVRMLDAVKDYIV